MFDCLIGYYQTTDFGCIWAGLHSHPQSRLALPGDKSVARVLMLTLALFLPYHSIHYSANGPHSARAGALHRYASTL
jgi:hypothetical protein